jgi:TrmH family RNA methyltransferase
LGATAGAGSAPEQFDLTAPTAFVLGNETQGLDADLPLDGAVTLPMQAGESLNVAMAGTALLFEAARQRRTVSSAS